MLSEIIFKGLLLASVLLSPWGAAVAADGGSLQGRLVKPLEDRPLQLLASDGRTVELAVEELLERTMRDPQLADRSWEMRGRALADGRFEVDRAFTIKAGQRYRVTYYCEICHITTHEPGRCMCCQEDTELREILEK